MVSSCITVMYPEKESDMSFSSEVKEELAKHISPARHCQIAELAALMNFSGQYGRSAEGDFMIGFQTENEAVVRKGFTLLKKTYNIDTDVKISEEQMRSVIDKIGDLSEPVSPLLIKNSCCQRAFLRGAFLCIGSMSDPQKSYHLEFVCTDEDKARQLQSVIPVSYTHLDVYKRQPKRSDYRKFKIKSVSGPDDYACMREVLTRCV